MPLNGGNALFAKVNKNSGAHQKNFNEDRPISLLGKCRPLHLFATNIKCMQICVGFHRRKYICHLYLLTYSLTALVFIVLLIFRLTDREARGWRARRRARRRPRSLAGCWVDRVVRTKVSGRRRIGLNVQCTNILYFRGIPA